MAKSKEPRINLLRYLQEEAREKKADTRFYIITGLIILLSITAMGGLGGAQKQKLQALKTDNTNYQQKVDELTSIVITLEPNLADAEGGIDNQAIINAVENQVKVQSDNITDLYMLSIPGVTIGKMDVRSNDMLSLTAYCQGQTKFIRFLDEVKNLESVKEVKNISSKYNDKTGEVSFNLTLEWGEVK